MGFTLPQFGIFAQTPDVSAGGVNLVVAFGSDTWRAVTPSQAPALLTGFREIAGPDGRLTCAHQEIEMMTTADQFQRHVMLHWISGTLCRRPTAASMRPAYAQPGDVELVGQWG